MGGRLRSQPFEGAAGVVAELGGMRFPVVVDGLLPLRRHARPADPAVPQPADRGRAEHGRRPGGRRPTTRAPLGDLPPLFREVADAWAAGPGGGAASPASRTPSAPRDVGALKALWNDLVPRWDDRTFYDFVATSQAFSKLSFRHREVFGQVGLRHRRLGLGLPELDAGDPPGRDDQLRRRPAPDRRRRRAGAARALGARARRRRALAGRHLAGVAARRRAPAGVAGSRRDADGRLAVTDAWGDARRYAAVLVTCQSWLLHDADRMRGEPVLAEDVDGPGPHPLHAVLQDLRDGRPAVLEGQGPARPAAT